MKQLAILFAIVLTVITAQAGNLSSIGYPGFDLEWDFGSPENESEFWERVAAEPKSSQNGANSEVGGPCRLLGYTGSNPNLNLYGGIAWGYTKNKVHHQYSLYYADFGNGTPLSGFQNVTSLSLGAAGGLSGPYRIRENAFSGRTALVSLSISSSTTNIGNRAFYGCKSLKTASLGSKLEILGDEAFSGCSALTSVSLGSKLKTIGNSAFKGCTWLASATFPETLRKIGDHAFEDCTALGSTGSLVIPEGVTHIGDFAFKNCRCLVSISLPSTLQHVGAHAFDGCINLQNVISVWGMPNVAEGVFKNCKKLKSIKLSCKTLAVPGGVTSIGVEAFYGCGSLSSVQMPSTAGAAPASKTIKTIGTRAFFGCKSLTAFEIPQKVSSLGSGVFGGCTSLTSISVESSNTTFKSISGVVFSKDGKTLIMYPPGKVGTDGKYKVPNGTQAIGAGAFQENTMISAVALGSSVLSIGADAFNGCTGLTYVEIPNSVTSIGAGAFKNCSRINSMKIPGRFALPELFPNAYSTITTVSVAGGATILAPSFCSGCASLTSVTIPNTVTSIGDRAFRNCSRLPSVMLPTALEHIGVYAFENCTSLMSLTMPATVRTIGTGAFSGCGKLASISMPNGVSSIGDHAFSGCANLQTVVIPNSVTAVGQSSFLNCVKLSAITIPYVLRNAVSGWGLPESCRIIFSDYQSLVIETDEALSFALTGDRYWEPVVVSGGTAPYTWSFVGEVPDWMDMNVYEWNDSECYLFGWPGEADIGETRVRVRVTDSVGDVAEKEFSIAVHRDTGSPPIVESRTPARYGVHVDLGSTMAFSVRASDPDGDQLSYQWTVTGSNGSETFDGGPDFTFDSGSFGKGDFHIEVAVGDGSHVTRWTEWKVMVSEPTSSDPLTIVQDALLPTARSGERYYLCFTVTGGEGPYSWEILDPEKLPDWIRGAYYEAAWDWERMGNTSVGRWLPPCAENVGTYAFAVRVTDGNGTTAEREFMLTVLENPNRKPVLVSATPASDSIRVEPGETISLSVEATDPDDDDLTYTWEVYKNGEWDSDLYRYRTDSTTYELPTSVGDEDNYSISVYALDGTWGPWMKSWTIRVAEKKPLATVEVETPTVVKEGVYTNVWLGVAGGSGPYTLALEGDIPDGMWYYDGEGDYEEAEYIAVQGEPTDGSTGTYTFTAVVTDADGATVEREFTLVVAENPNHRPVFESWTPENFNLRIDPGTSRTFTVAASDPDGDGVSFRWLVWEYDSNGEYLREIDGGNADSFTLATTEGAECSYQIRPVISDGEREDCLDWFVRVAPYEPLKIPMTNLVQEIANQPNSGFAMDVTLVAHGGTEPYSWRLGEGSSLPAGLELEEEGYFSGWIGVSDAGEHSFEVIVTDADGTEASANVTLTISAIDGPAFFGFSPNAPSITVRVGESVEIEALVSASECEEVLFDWEEVDEATESLVSIGITNAVFSWAPTSADIGERQLYFSYSTVELALRGHFFGEWAPIIHVLPADAIVLGQDLPHAMEGVPYSVQLTASGGTAPYTWSLEKVEYPDGEISEDGLLTVWTDQFEPNEEFCVLQFPVTATDAEGKTATQSVYVVLEPNPNHRPVITSQEPWDDGIEWDGILRVGEAQTFSVEAHDPEGEPLTYAWYLDDLPLESDGNTLVWTPESVDVGEHGLRVEVSDGERTNSDWGWWFTVVTTNVLSADISIPTAVVGTPYSASFSVAGGTSPYVWGVSEYAMAREANSFAETGVAQDWTEDDGCWRVALPFSFPFYGETYDEIWISDNGTICLDGEFSECSFAEDFFREHALIAPCWWDFDGSQQVVYVDSQTNGQITICWNAVSYGSVTGNRDVFSVTLCQNGTIRFAYQDARWAEIVGISAGDGARTCFIEGDPQGELVDGAADIVFRPAPFAPGLSFVADGTISGTPSASGTYRFAVSVSDVEGASWNGSAVLHVVAADAEVTLTTPEPVPYSWLSNRAASILAAHDGNYEAAAMATAANGANKVWECYVAGISPTNPAARFEAVIEIGADGKPAVTWTPDLNEGGTKNERVYRVLGAKTLGGGWDDVTNMADPDAEGYRFFKAMVEMP